MSKVSRQLMLMTAIERGFRTAIYQEKNRYIRQSALDWTRNRTLSEASFEAHTQNMQDIFNQYYAKTIQRFTVEISQQMESEKKATLWEHLLMQWISNYGGSKAKETATTTRKDINRVLNIAFESELPADKVIRSILSARGISAWRSATIARTETSAAASHASYGTAKSIEADTGVRRKKAWNPVEDDRTRESHIAMGSYPAIGLDEYFIVGGESMLRPNDQGASAENVINCRCVLTYESAYAF